MGRHWRRIAPGQYVSDDEGGGYYLIDRGFGDLPDTDRRRQTWVVALVSRDGVAEIVSEWPTKRQAAGSVPAGRSE